MSLIGAGLSFHRHWRRRLLPGFLLLQGPPDQHRHLAPGNGGGLCGSRADKPLADHVVTGGTVAPRAALAVRVPAAPKHHRTGHCRIDRIIRPIPGAVIAGYQQIGDAVAHIGLGPGGHIRKIAGPGVMLRVDLPLAMQPGDDGGHLSAGQPLIQHQTAGAVPPVHAPLPQVRASFVDFRRLLRSKSGAGQRHCQRRAQQRTYCFLHLITLLSGKALSWRSF